MNIRHAVVIAYIVFAAAIPAAARAEPFPAGQMTAKSQILIEAHTGKILYEKNARTRLYPASTTKMTTLLVALEQGCLDDTVVVGENAANTEGSSMDLEAGERLKFIDLLYGVMLVSGNDATVAVAEHTMGSVENYAAAMTKLARSLGAYDTNFVNTSGLPAPDHYSTAYDLAKIASYGYQIPLFREIVATRQKEIHAIEPVKTHLLKNTNKLLFDYLGANGIKTGYTEAAGECLVASAERGAVRLIAVVMHAEDERRWEEAAALLDYGFRTIRPELAYTQYDLATTVRVRGGKNFRVKARPKNDIQFPVSDNDRERFSIRMNPPDYADAPVRAGQKLGAVEILYDQQVVDHVDLIATENVDAGFDLISLLVEWYENLFHALKGLFTFS